MKVRIQIANGATRGHNATYKAPYAGSHWAIFVAQEEHPEYFIGRSTHSDRWLMGNTPRDIFAEKQWDLIFSAIFDFYEANDWEDLHRVFEVEI